MLFHVFCSLAFQILLLGSFFVLVCALSPSYGEPGWIRRRIPLPIIVTRPPPSNSRQPPFTRRPTSSLPTPRPTTSASSPRPTVSTSTPRTTPCLPTPQPTPVPSISKKRCGCILSKLPRYLPNSIRRRPVCLRLSESQLLQRLKDVGGYNPRYVAINRKGACKFTDLSTDLQPLPRNFSGPFKNPRERRKRMVTLSSGSVLRGCWSRGSFVDGSPLRRLCTECSATTQLPSSVFPPFINEVLCADNDHFCYRHIGLCIQKVLKFTFLRRTGDFERDDDLSTLVGADMYVEKTETFQQDIRSCCECRVFPFAFGGR